MKKSDEGRRPSKSFAMGAVALVFLAIGYQTALLVHKAAVEHIASLRDRPDTVFIIREVAAPGALPGKPKVVRKEYAKRPEAAKAVRRQLAAKACENFPFDPNTAPVEDLMRLGFSQKQAASIDNYRRKGGRFRRKEDFARSYVVADSVYRRLEPYIDIPKLDINSADSAAFVALPGIGPYFAAKMVEYRKLLGGYSYPRQLMDIYRFDEERFDGLSDLITIGPAEPYPLWTLPEDSLKKHPYIGSRAHGVVLFREHNPPQEWTVDGLCRAGVLDREQARKLAKCNLLKISYSVP